MEEGHADINCQDENGRTPLHLAASFGRTDTAEVLIQNDADMDIQDNDGRTPIMLAQESGNFEIAQMLIDKSNR